MGRILNKPPRTPGRHTPEAVSATTTPNQHKDETAVISLRSDETLETLWTSALEKHHNAVMAKQVADEAQGASDRASADAARLHKEGMDLRAQADAKLREAEEVARAAQADQKRADDAGAAHKKLTAITADLTTLVDSLHAKAVTENPDLAHPRHRRPLPQHPQSQPEAQQKPPQISADDPLGDGQRRNGPVTNTTAPIPVVPPAQPQRAAS